MYADNPHYVKLGPTEENRNMVQHLRDGGPRCKSCGAPIVWAPTSRGRAMPCDPGLRTVITPAGEVVRGLAPHWATCPSAEEHRKPEH